MVLVVTFTFFSIYWDDYKNYLKASLSFLPIKPQRRNVKIKLPSYLKRNLIVTVCYVAMLMKFQNKSD